MIERDELPEGWTAARIADLCELNPKHDRDLAPETEVTFAPMAAVDDVSGALDPTQVRPYGEVRKGFAHFAEGDVLFAKITPCMENGKAAVARRLKNGLGCSTTELVVLRPKGAVVADFLHRFMRQESYRRAARAAMTGVVGQARVPREFIEQSEIPLPPLAEQKRIVAKLEELTARSRRAKEALDAVPPLLDQLRQSILAAAFRGDLTADWRAKNPTVEPAEKLLARIREERKRTWDAAYRSRALAKGRVVEGGSVDGRYKEPVESPSSGHAEPPEWATATVELVGDLLLGRRRAAEEYIDGVDGRTLRPYLRVANVKRDRLVLDDVLSMPFSPQELQLYRLVPGDIVLSEGQSPELVGQSGIFHGGYEDLCIQATVHRFRAYDFATTSDFAQLVFLSHLLTGVFRRAASLTTNIAHLTSERLRPLPFPLPPIAEQRLIVKRVRAALARIAGLELLGVGARDRLGKLEEALLNKAFRGELVRQNGNDEPATKLLAGMRESQTTEAPSSSRRGKANVAADSAAEQGALRRVRRMIPANRLLDFGPGTGPCVGPDAVFAALWPRGPLDKPTAIHHLANHLRDTGQLHFADLHPDDPLYAQLLAAIESAVKAAHLDRPQRGHVRAIKPDPATYTPGDWRHALLTSLGPEPTERDTAIRTAAAWAREHLGLAFSRLRSNGHIVEGLRDALARAIRNGEVLRLGASQILHRSRPVPSAR